MRGGKRVRGGMSKSFCATAIVTIFLLWTSPVPALDRMGPPVAQFGQGQINVGLDYASSDTDLEASGHSIDTSVSTFNTDAPIIIRRDRKHTVAMNRVDTDRLYTTIGYGINEQVDVFFRLGEAQTGWSNEEGTSLALGGGIRSTFYATDRLKIGGLAQIGWSEVDFDAISFPVPDSDMATVMHGEMSLYEIQVAVAASYLLTDHLTVYGGPFLYFADGDLDLRRDGSWGLRLPENRGLSLVNSYDLDETSLFGAYVGAQYKIAERMSWGIEFQYTDDADAVTTGLTWRL
jgi:hypothetical protein